MLSQIFGKTILKNSSSGLNNPQASYGTVSTTNVPSFLSLTEYTDAFLWLLKFLPTEDLLYIKLLSKPCYHAFHDQEIFFPLKEFIVSSTNTDLDELSTLFVTERNRKQKLDRFDREFKHIYCQKHCSQLILCCYMSRNIESDYEFTDNQFLSQECFLVSLKIAFWFIMTSGVVLSPLLLENRLGTDKKKELVSTYLITVFSTVIAVLCLNVTCWVYTSCYRPLNHYCKQVSKLRVIQNDINNAKMTNTLFANKERAGFNDDSSESSPMEEGLLSNFIDEAELCEETLEYNTTAGRVKTP